MDRTSASNYADIGGGKRGFRDRNLGAGTRGTTHAAADRNAVQEEILAVIEAAGLTPNAADWAQLLDALRELFGGRGVLVALSSNAVIANAVETMITWPAPIYDDAGFWGVGAPTRLTVPVGVSRLRITCQTTWDAQATGDRKLRVLKNGSIEGNGLPAMRLSGAGAADVTILNASAGIVPVTPGDYIQLAVYQDRGANLDLRAVNTWMHVEAAR